LTGGMMKMRGVRICVCAWEGGMRRRSSKRRDEKVKEREEEKEVELEYESPRTTARKRSMEEELRG
jgi:hypothetical protein